MRLKNLDFGITLVAILLVFYFAEMDFLQKDSKNLLIEQEPNQSEHQETYTAESLSGIKKAENKEGVFERQEHVDVLNEQEKETFFRDIQIVFTELAPSIIDTAKLTPVLSKLNARGGEGKRAILDNLRLKPSEKDLLSRMGQVDYLIYRIGFDPTTKGEIRDLVEEPISNAWEDEATAITFAERAELIGGIAKWDWALASDMLSKIEHPVFRDIALYEAYSAIVGLSTGRDRALAMIHEIDRSFVP